MGGAASHWGAAGCRLLRVCMSACSYMCMGVCVCALMGDGGG